MRNNCGDIVFIHCQAQSKSKYRLSKYMYKIYALEKKKCFKWSSKLCLLLIVSSVNDVPAKTLIYEHPFGKLLSRFIFEQNTGSVLSCWLKISLIFKMARVTGSDDGRRSSSISSNLKTMMTRVASRIEWIKERHIMWSLRSSKLQQEYFSFIKKFKNTIRN